MVTGKPFEKLTLFFFVLLLSSPISTTWMQEHNLGLTDTHPMATVLSADPQRKTTLRHLLGYFAYIDGAFHRSDPGSVTAGDLAAGTLAAQPARAWECGWGRTAPCVECPCVGQQLGQGGAGFGTGLIGQW